MPTSSSTRPNIGSPAKDRFRLDRKIQASLEDTVVSSPNCVELLPTPAVAFQERLLRLDAHVAELFHANSRLTSVSSANQPLDPVLLASVRQWFHESAYAPDPADLDLAEAEALHIRMPIERLDRVHREVLGAVPATPELVESLYALDLWILFDGDLFRYPVGADAVWLERRLEPSEERRLTAALIGLPPVGPSTALFLLVAAPWRYMQFQGPRGYRHCLVDVGRAITLLRHLADDIGAQVVHTLDMLDDSVDRSLDLDGIERTAVAAVLMNDPEAAP